MSLWRWQGERFKKGVFNAAGWFIELINKKKKIEPVKRIEEVMLCEK